MILRGFVLEYAIDFIFDSTDAAFHRRFAHAKFSADFNDAMAGHSQVKHPAFVLSKIAQFTESVAFRLDEFALEVQFVLHRITPFTPPDGRQAQAADR